MQRRIFVPVLCVMLFSLTPLFAQEFSGDFVETSGNKPGAMGKVYAGKDKMRFESLRGGGNSTGGSAVVIYNYSTQTADVLMPERKMYIESTSGHLPGWQRSWNFFRTLDVDNACADWLKMVHNPNGTCHKVGSDTVNGRSAVKYEGVSTSGETSTYWLDRSLRFPIKWESKSSSGEMRNIKEGAQPASLFEVPSDYQKFQMPAGMPGMPPRQ